MKIEDRKYTVFDYIRIPISITPFVVILTVLLRILVACIPSLQTLAIAGFIDTAIHNFTNGGTFKIYAKLLLVIGVLGLSWLSAMIISYFKIKLGIKINEVILPTIVKKRSRLAYAYIENEETWELIARVGEDPSEHIIKGFDNLLNLIEYFIKTIGLLLIIAFKLWWVAVAVLIISIPFFVLAYRNGNVQYEAFTVTQKHKRRANYLREILYSREYIEERALFGYTDHINEMWFDKYETARKIELEADKQNFIRVKSADIVMTFLSLLISLVLLIPIIKGTMTVGIYIGLVTAAFGLVSQMSWQLTDVMKKYVVGKLYLNDLTSFSALKEVKGADCFPHSTVHNKSFETLEFRNVHFTYPGTDKKVLAGLTMKLEKNKRYAFVGRNGAGKTTITKLLTGLYDNYDGEILINGVEMRNYTHEQLKAFFSIVYQDFAKYYITLKDNVLLGNISKFSEIDVNDTYIKNILDSIELTDVIDELPNGISTHLGKLVEGSVDLSGGQWQRVAIARALVSEAPIQILDEPTAALDPISESNTYKLFERVSKSKTTIFITHRLGAARVADEILLLENGIIAERGCHHDLIKNNGIYAEMFQAQRMWYND